MSSGCRGHRVTDFTAAEPFSAHPVAAPFCSTAEPPWGTYSVGAKQCSWDAEQEVAASLSNKYTLAVLPVGIT